MALSSICPCVHFQTLQLKIFALIPEAYFKGKANQLVK